jgi:hypothetical protein
MDVSGVNATPVVSFIKIGLMGYEGSWKMITMTVSVEDDSKGYDLLRFLQDIDYLKVQVDRNSQERPSLDDSFGIWKGREITLDDIRKRGWERC